MEIPSNLQDMFAQAQKLQQDLNKIKEEVEKKHVEASAGGGMVVAKINGKQEIIELKIEKEVVNPDDIQMLQDLVKAAVNEGVRKSRALLSEEMKKVTGGIPIPGFNS